MVTVTHTRTHVFIPFANPHLVCEVCGNSVRRYHDAERCGCHNEMSNVPCGHIGVRSVCPSWGPVDGCTCSPPHIAPQS
jgi:hypothetical protein